MPGAPTGKAVKQHGGKKRYPVQDFFSDIVAAKVLQISKHRSGAFSFVTKTFELIFYIKSRIVTFFSDRFYRATAFIRETDSDCFPNSAGSVQSHPFSGVLLHLWLMLIIS